MDEEAMGSGGGLVVGKKMRMCLSVHERVCSIEKESTYEIKPYSSVYQLRVY